MNEENLNAFGKMLGGACYLSGFGIEVPVCFGCGMSCGGWGLRG